MAEREDRVSVKTYVPKYQKEIWIEHAEELDMSQSEFVRTMVQAGRTEFDVPALNDSNSNQVSTTQNAGLNIESQVVEVLEGGGVLDWEELTEKLIGDLESDMDEAIESLQSDNIVRYSGKESGYTLVKDVE